MATRKITDVEATQAVKTGHVRYILAGGLALAAMAAIAFFGFHLG